MADKELFPICFAQEQVIEACDYLNELHGPFDEFNLECCGSEAEWRENTVDVAMEHFNAALDALDCRAYERKLVGREPIYEDGEFVCDVPVFDTRLVCPTEAAIHRDLSEAIGKIGDQESATAEVIESIRTLLPTRYAAELAASKESSESYEDAMADYE